MDNLKNKANDMMGGGIESQLKDLDFPCSKDQLLSQLEKKGVPSQLLDKIRDTDTSKFDSVDDVKKKAGL